MLRIMLVAAVLLSAPVLAHEPAAEKPAAAESHQHALVATPVHSDAEGSVYGAAMPSGLTAIAIDKAARAVSEHSSEPRAFSGRITEVCQKMGCWMVLSSEGDFARVVMHDHSFAVPKDSNSDAVVYGTLSEKKRSEKEIAHMAEDGAKSGAVRELQIDAVSVLIRPAS